MPLDDPFELRILVARTDEEEPGLRAHAAVGLGIDHDLLRAAGVSAFAEIRRLGVGRAVALLEPRDVFVHLAEERFVAGGPLLPERRHTTEANVNPCRTRGKAVYEPETMAHAVRQRRSGDGCPQSERSDRGQGGAAPVRLARPDALRVQRTCVPGDRDDRPRRLPRDSPGRGRCPHRARPSGRRSGARGADPAVRGPPGESPWERRPKVRVAAYLQSGDLGCGEAPGEAGLVVGKVASNLEVVRMTAHGESRPWRPALGNPREPPTPKPT